MEEQEKSFDGIYDHAKVNATLGDLCDVIERNGLNLLETYKVCEAIMRSAEAIIVEKADEASAVLEKLNSL